MKQKIAMIAGRLCAVLTLPDYLRLPPCKQFYSHVYLFTSHVTSQMVRFSTGNKNKLSSLLPTTLMGRVSETNVDTEQTMWLF